MWKVILISGSGQSKYEAATKKEAHDLIPWNKISSILRLDGRTYLCKLK